jgi:ankyrin repeat protein
MIVKLFIERNDIKIDLKNNKDRTPLSQAIEKRYEAVVKLLIKRDDVEINSKNNNDMMLLS